MDFRNRTGGQQRNGRLRLVIRPLQRLKTNLLGLQIEKIQRDRRMVRNADQHECSAQCA